MRKIILLLPLAVALSAVLAFALVQQNSGEAAPGGEPSGGPVTSVNYLCYTAPSSFGAPPPLLSVSNQFEDSLVTIFDGTLLCPPTGKNAGTIPPLPTIRCYPADSPFSHGIKIDIADQYGIAAPTIGEIVIFCVPAIKAPGLLPSEPYYACYSSSTPMVTFPEPVISNQFFNSDALILDDARVLLCVASTKGGAGDLGLPSLTCYVVLAGSGVFASVPFETQFGPDGAPVGLPELFCTEAVKLVPTPTFTVTTTPTVTITPMPPTPTPPPVNYTCYDAPGPVLASGPVAVENQFGSDLITVSEGIWVCPITDKNNGGIPPLPTLRCFDATSLLSPSLDVTVLLEDQYGLAEQLIEELSLFCAPAGKDSAPFDSAPYYACYNSIVGMPTNPDPVISNQFVANDLLTITNARVGVCIPSLKEGGGLLAFPPLTCYGVLPGAGTPADASVAIETQFGSEELDVFEPQSFCTEAIKLVKLPDPGDTDGDGCSDVKENRPKADADVGGGRDWLNPWDFYDVAIAGGIKGHDSQIDLFNDIVGVIDHYAPTGLEPVYDAWYDRGPVAGPNDWNMTAPDNRIDLFNDIVGVINQFGHDCR